MWLIGGSSFDTLTASNASIHKLDLSSHMWDTVQALGEIPDTLDEHTAVSDGQHIYTFGGFLGGERSNQVHHLDTKTMEWTHLKTKSDKKTPQPKPRSGHAAVLLEDKKTIVIFGGKDDENNKLNDLWKFDVEKKEWTEMVISDEASIPMARSGHTATLKGKYIFIFGGIFEITKELNDMHAYDIENNRWVPMFAYAEQKSPPIFSPNKLAGFSGSPSGKMRSGTWRGGDGSPGAGSFGGFGSNNSAKMKGSSNFGGTASPMKK